jgi:paraquat-inducible protein B
VDIFAHIEAEHAHLVRRASRFWNISGFRAEFSLTRGLKVEGESLESLVGGGVAFRSPASGERAGDGSRFELLNQAPEALPDVPDPVPETPVPASGDLSKLELENE